MKTKVSSQQKLFVIIVLCYVAVFCYFYFFETSEYSAGFPIRSGSDARDYMFLSKNLIEHHSFPSTFRTPGYPVFVAAILFVFKTFTAVSLFQILLTAYTSVLIFKMARAMMPERPAFVAALLYGLGLNTMTLSINLLSEVLFIFLIVASIYILFFSRYAMRAGAVAGAGLVLGAAILVRPIGLFLPVFYGLFYLVVYRFHGWKTILRNVIIFAVGCVLVVTPWMARNARLSGHFALTSVGMYDVLFYNVSYFLADKDTLPRDVVDEKLKQETGIEDPSRYGDLANSDRISAVAFSYLSRYPLGYAWYHAKKEAQVFVQSGLAYFLNEAPRAERTLARWKLVDTPPGPNINRLFEQGQYRKVFAALATQPLLFLDRLFWMAVSLLMVIALWLHRKDGFFWHRLFFLAIIFYLPFFGAPIEDVRYRVPAHPFMFMLAVFGVYNLYKILALTFQRE